MFLHYNISELVLSAFDQSNLHTGKGYQIYQTLRQKLLK